MSTDVLSDPYQLLLDRATALKTSDPTFKQVLDLIHDAYYLGKREALTTAREEVMRSVGSIDISLQHC